MQHRQVLQSVSTLDSVNTSTDHDHSPFSYNELKKMFLKLVSLEFDVEICKEAFSECMSSNVKRLHFSQETLKRAIEMTPKAYARNVMCKDPSTNY